MLACRKPQLPTLETRSSGQINKRNMKIESPNGEPNDKVKPAWRYPALVAAAALSLATPEATGDSDQNYVDVTAEIAPVSEKV